MGDVAQTLAIRNRFDFSQGAIQVLEQYLEGPDMSDNERRGAVALMEAAAAELALLSYAVPEWGSRSPDWIVTPSIIGVARHPSLVGANIPVQRTIGILTTVWYQCSPTGTCARIVELLRGKTWDWTDIGLFVGDASKAEMLRDHKPRDSNEFAEFADRFVRAQQEWLTNVTTSEFFPGWFEPVLRIRLALWHLRFQIITQPDGEMPTVDSLLSGFERMLLGAEFPQTGDLQFYGPKASSEEYTS